MQMALERTLQVRVSRQMEQDLRKDASTMGLSEAEALRHAIGLLHRVAKRQRNIHVLVEQARIGGREADKASGFQ